MSSLKVLLAEDDPNLGQILKEYLEVKGYQTLLCRDGQEALKVFEDPSERYDLCIFDVMMPKMDGFALAEKVRTADADVPIIFLTAKSMKEDAITGLKAGADDYITKPFSMEELLLRMQAILRRVQRQPDEEEEADEYKIGELVFDPKTQQLRYPDGEERRLTSKESALLKMLAQHKNRTLERSLALKKIWLDDNYFNARSMDVYITKLRKYLKPEENVQIINVHGQGFKLIELNDKK